MTWRVVSRASRLALVQVDEALEVLRPHLTASPQKTRFVVRRLESYGDKHLALSLLDGQAPADVFTRELDEELRSGRSDFAVHSAKDLPHPLPADLDLVALLPASDQTDSLACRAGLGPTLDDLAPGSRVGTSSALRQTELKALRPDLEVVGIRGTIEQRLAQLDRGAYEAVIVATCALRRLGLDHRIGQVLPFETNPLQGHLAVTARKGRGDVRDLWSVVDLRRTWSRVALVGAGPGDPQLLTLRAAQLLRSAQIVFSDSLANAEILRGLKAEVRFVGKRGDAGGEQQDKINQALAEAARKGTRVVRLKGGDPMIFGRGTEEREYLEARLIEVEVVPGISSAVAASSYSSVPLTERGISNSVAFCLGAPVERIGVPDAQTLVFYMASATLAAIVDKVLESGRSPGTAVALVRNASLPDQQVWIRSLGDLRDELAARPEHPYGSPLLAFIGPVVRPDRASSWFDRLPRVWYTGTDPTPELAPARRICRPLIEIRPVEDPSALDSVLTSLRSFRWVVFTSRHAVKAAFDRLDALGFDTRWFSGAKVAAVGRTTALALVGHGLRADLVPEVETAKGLLEALAQGSVLAPGSRVWLPCSDQAPPTLENGLTALGARVEKTVAYHNVEVELCPPDIDLEALDQVILTSGSTARAFARFFPTPPAGLLLIPRGESTARVLGELFPGRPQGRLSQGGS